MSSSALEDDDAAYGGAMAGANTPLLNEAEELIAQEQARASQLQKDPKFYTAFLSVEEAILNNIQPERIVQGSSGSYFCRNMERVTVGVFKPKNEEPYGHLNPKWMKWMHKTCCPCCFGRSCLVPNQGYLSEAGASLVDVNLRLNIVPRTKIVKLASPNFYYSRFDRAATATKRAASERFPDSLGRHLELGLPLKVGSFQMFVKGYKDAFIVLRHLDLDKMSPEARHSLQMQFEALVVLDYIIRNTDRGNDNWLLRHEKTEEGESIQLAAIDNGLAFPFKHPDNWRTYPFHWAYLPLAKEKLSAETRDKLMPLLDDDDFVEELVDQLFVLFSQDPGFSKSLFEEQMGVMRGQILNLKKALRLSMTPAELVQMPTLKIVVHKTTADTAMGRARRMYQQIITQRLPTFRCC
eukprot:m.65457 g.65457  ORF g.65457 m.65457 type:complete len:409 (+) comp13985_c0_seq1:176-1402(+)